MAGDEQLYGGKDWEFVGLYDIGISLECGGGRLRDAVGSEVNVSAQSVITRLPSGSFFFASRRILESSNPATGRK